MTSLRFACHQVVLKCEAEGFHSADLVELIAALQALDQMKEMT